MNTTIAVITGTVGSPLLGQALASVRAQTYPSTQHWIVVDGPRHEATVRAIVGASGASAASAASGPRERILVLPENTGGDGYVGHRINAAVPWVVNAEYVCFLDEDNAYEPTHLERMVQAIERSPWKARWAHSLRQIIAQDGSPLCIDACESLGGIRHSVLGPSDFLVDTNCYLLETSLARHLSPCWDVRARPGPRKLEADRAVCMTLLESGLFPAVSKAHTVRYRAGSRADSVQPAFFSQGNAVTQYNAALPDVYLFHMTADWTRACLSNTTPRSPLDPGAPTMWDGLRSSVNLLDGFVHARYLPPGAVVVAVIRDPSHVPLAVLERRELHRVVVLLAKPPEWQGFCDDYADCVLTDYQDVMEYCGNKAAWCPCNMHVLDLDKAEHRTMALRRNYGVGATVMRGPAPIDVLQRFSCVDIPGSRVTEAVYDAFMAGCIPIFAGPVPPQFDIPADMYLSSPEELDAMDVNDIAAKKMVIITKRDSVLRRVGVQIFARVLKLALTQYFHFADLE